MSEWKLKDCCLSISDGDHLPPPKTDKGIPFITISNISSTNHIDFKDTLFVPKAYYDNLDKIRKPQPNDIIYSVVGSFGKPVLIKENKQFVFQRHIAILRPNNEVVDSRFLYYVMLSRDFYMQADTVAIGAAQRTISLTSLRNMKVNLPPLPTQHRIATILSRYDSLIENYQKQIKLLEEAAQRLYKEWFVDLHFPGHENTKIVDGVPEGWEKKTIDDVTCKVTTGLNPRKNFVLGKGSNYYVTIKNMADNTLFLDDGCDRVDNEALEKINKRSDLKIGDILFSGIGTIGRVALVDIPTNNWNVSESVFTLRVNDIVTKEFLYLMLLSPDMQNYCQSNAHGAAQKGIRMADLKAYSFNLPPFGVIQKFTNLVTPTIKKVSSIRNQIRLLTEARDRLLPRLMSGDIKV
ncbi:MAG: restriction endonuclease subunit S [Bacteroidales bacterium]|nr:restriction endonuclease subunit S [Bacteroidales bacterium]